MSEPRGLLRNYSRLVLAAVIVAAVVYLVRDNLHTFWNIFLAVMGFSAVVFIHECGHFIVAKLSNIKVETFSIFLPPVLLGVRRTEEGLRFRILPRFFPKANDESGDGRLSFAIGKKGKAGETEYRIGLIPLAGYVKMLGQEDVGADKQTDDPRAFGNKSIGVRMAVVSAGVIFNVIAAVGILMAVYLIGINRLPAVVGGVVPDSPAARTGIKAGDEIIEVAGKSDGLDFGNILLAAVLSDKGEEVELKVRHEDSSEERFAIVAEQMPGMVVRRFGFRRPMSLTIAEVSDVNALLERTGLLAGDRIKSVNGREVQAYWELEEIIQDALVPAVTVLAKRPAGPQGYELIESKIPLDLYLEKKDVESESELGHICSMVPRLRITLVSGRASGSESSLRSGDIILAAGDVENPTYKEMREVTTEYEGKKLPIKLLRTAAHGLEESLIVTVVPKRRDGRVLIGLGLALDAEHAVVAKTIAAEDGPPKLAIPRGASITAVDGADVTSFYDVIRQIRKNAGRRITIDYRLNEETAGSVALSVDEPEKFVTVKSTFAEFVPFESLERLIKADGLVNAFTMSCRRSVWFIVQTYATLKGLLARTINPQALSGPVGIAAISYKVIEQSPLNFLYLLAFISVNLAVINFLPIPVTDGGVFILLIVEKIKGAPVNVRVQEVITYAGLVFIATAFLYLTYNDIVNFFR